MSALHNTDWERTVEALYRCYRCGAIWRSVWNSACDDECGDCGARDVTASAYRILEGDGAGEGVVRLR